MSYLYSIILICTFFSAQIHKASTTKSHRSHGFIPTCTILLCGILVLTFLTQYFHPQLLGIFERNTTRVFSGQIWRIVTSLFFQDGGEAGAIFNIASLLFIGSMAEYFFTKKQWLFLIFGGALVAQVVALFWQPIGAGNSIANFSLAGGLLAMVLFQADKKVWVISAVGIIAAIFLLFVKDIHGVAVCTGILFFVIFKQNHHFNNK